MAVLHHQFGANGLKSCLEVGSLREPPAPKPALQILNTDPVGMGSHWILVSTYGCNDGDVDVFDSAGGTYLRLTCLRSVANFAKPVTSMALVLKFVDVQVQPDTDSCGIFAIANCVSLLHGIDPVTVEYDVNAMREHLHKCMANRHFDMFPHKINEPGDRYRNIHVERLHCSCKLPEDSDLYFECISCKHWFHTECENLGHKTVQQIKRDKQLRCVKCASKRRGRGRGRGKRY